MKRYVFIWLPDWPLDRIRRQESSSVSEHEPFALVVAHRRGLVVYAAGLAARALGVHPGMLLADARAIVPALRSRPAEPRQDRLLLVRLARWCGRYGPSRNVDIGIPPGGEDDDPLRDHGIWIETTGVAHLFGGESALAADLCGRLGRFGFTVRVGISDTPGAAWALARFAVCTAEPGHAASPRWTIAPHGRTLEAVVRLPVEALRIPRDSCVALRRLGFRCIGDLHGVSRVALERRFRRHAAADSVLARIDALLGASVASLPPLGEVPQLVVRRSFTAPLISSEALAGETGSLLMELCKALDIKELGVRRLRLLLYRADGTCASIVVGTSKPSRSSDHLMDLLAGRLGNVEAGFGIDMLAVEALAVERVSPADLALSTDLLGAGLSGLGGLGALIDRLSERIGSSRITMLLPNDSHLPERAEFRHPALAGLTSARRKALRPLWGARRPALMFSRPEPITVMAEIPDGAPARFIWRRVARRVMRAEGPERIAPEWWRTLCVRSEHGSGDGRPQDPHGAFGEPEPISPLPRTRDYYRVEDASGSAYWVFRDGLHGGAADDGRPPHWFMHGVFA